LAKDVDIDKLAKKTKGYVGSDVEGVCREAAMAALREDINAKEVKAKHFDTALETVRPSITDEIEEAYGKVGEYFSTARAKQIKEEKVSYFG